MTDRTEAAAQWMHQHDQTAKAPHEFVSWEDEDQDIRELWREHAAGVLAAADAVPSDASVEAAISWVEKTIAQQAGPYPFADPLPSAITGIPVLLRSLAAREAALKEEAEHLKEQVVRCYVGGFEAGIAQGREEAAKVAEQVGNNIMWETTGEGDPTQAIAAAIRALGEKAT